MDRTHEMRMVRVEQSGFEEWACTTCGRRMLLRWPPAYEKRVIEPGDEKACHVGSAASDVPPEPDAPPEAAAAPPDDAATVPAEPKPHGNRRRWLRETAVGSPAMPAVPPRTPAPSTPPR